ncbi:MAG: AAA family ATPase, partial [Phycisphaerae bacterium]
MYVSHVEIKNFRLLANVKLSFEETTTVIVGRNNSGKTSLTELFRRLCSDKSPEFHLEDFSLPAHEEFWKGFKLFRKGSDAQEVRKALPEIELKLTVAYKNTASPTTAPALTHRSDPSCSS